MMTYRKLLDALELMRENDATLLNHVISVKVTDDEYFNLEDILVADDYNEYVESNAPVLIAST